MQVNHVEDHVTHAVIGGKKTIEFGISNSAEFFNILSSTLYSDQILAVVREVLCNAWDAHIVAGCTDKAVEVTLTSDKFTIKDQGLGIPHDLIGEIYGTYGNSTKANDGNQTGGFGLGCKAPFAYTDHFEVTSANGGTKTIYALSKSSAQAMGKPGITPITSFPSPETGLVVSIPVKNSSDRHRFHELIKRIASNGDMNVSLNGGKITTLDFDTSTANWMLLKSQTVLTDQTPIVVRYGNVIYPIPSAEAINHEYDLIKKHLKSLVKGSYDSTPHILIFQAPPHSISVTPSRESLSMQEHTNNTLLGLFKSFLSLLDTSFKDECSKVATETTDEAVNAARYRDLLNTESQLPLSYGSRKDVELRINTAKGMAKAFMASNYPSDLAFRKKDIAHRLEKMAAAQLLDRGLVQTYLRDLAKVDAPFSDTRYSYSAPAAGHTGEWFQRQVIAPLVTRVSNDKSMDVSKLYVYDRAHLISSDYSGSAVFVPAKTAKLRHSLVGLPYLRKIVVISTTQKDIDRAEQHNVMTKLGTNPGFLFYHVSRKKEAGAEAKAFFEKAGFNVVDLTVRYSWDAPIERVTYERKPKKKGLPLLDAALTSSSIDTDDLFDEDVARIEDPEFIVLVKKNKDSDCNKIDDFSRAASTAIVRLFGKQGGAVINTIQYDAYKAKGAKDLVEFVIDKVIHYIASSPTILEHYAYSRTRAEALVTRGYEVQTLQAVFNNKELATTFGLVNNMTEEDKLYLTIWQSLWDDQYKRTDAMKRAFQWLEAIPLAQAVHDLVDKVKDNQHLNLLNHHQLESCFKYPHHSHLKDKALKILLSIINS